MESISKATDEAKDLLSMTRAALSKMDLINKKFDESEVHSRHQSLVITIIMYVNDLDRMVSLWEKENRNIIVEELLYAGQCEALLFPALQGDAWQ